MLAPCYKCEDRSVRCHSTCEKYKAFAKERENYRKQQAEEREMNSFYGEIVRFDKRRKSKDDMRKRGIK